MGKALFSVGGSSGLVWEDFHTICTACDEMGYWGFYPSDHLMQIQQGRGPSSKRLEGLTVMAAMSGHTKNLRLGMLVVNNNLRHPVILAKMINTIDHASGGRAELGIGSGNVKKEHEVHGIPFPAYQERIDRLDESLSVMKALWTEDPATFKGQYFSLDEAPSNPFPVQRPHPPIIIGGTGERTMKVAAKHATDYNQITSRLDAIENLGKFKGFLAEQGRRPEDMRFSVQIQMRLTDDAADVDKYISGMAEIYASQPSHHASAHYGSMEEQLRDSMLWGSVDNVAEQVGRWIEGGINHFIIMTPRPFNREMMETFAAKVAPQFAK
jgi:alkanesulfonate monooxygenase SsuD/methylene tetrahydromethanopterin reductase-like flavin-dependent oxidoreductase (luciferase family)